MKLNHHQWKLVFDAVRKQQVNSIVDGSEYKEYDAILTELWDLAYSETYANIQMVEDLANENS
ncbi:hypothetical protein PQC12_gp118 [Synechococcus phage S-SCSM1]|uniref:Uncharacterized protein n=1 Tax=Synechococcus phage S-SCSM1 TaxID=2588487 RepID=A0A6M2ZHP2_9CAUD|nr:hypothetical protein PQC12_gp118 [Synechococcus phage S-SCSM1]QFG06518.1 hypothetical protein SSCSM1_254 [Synechococcus phage S-SCSM1]